MNPTRTRMTLLAKPVTSLALLLALAGCQTPPATGTYDAIRKEVAAGAGAPKRTAAPALDAAVADALLPPASSLATQLPKARPALEERFNVSFNNVPAQQFFRSIVAGTRYNILVHPEVGGAITVNLKDVTLPETLDAVREMYGYDYKIEGTRISIKPLTMQTRMFHVNYLVGKRAGLSTTRVSSTSVQNAGTSSNGANGANGNQNGNGLQNNLGTGNQNGQNGQNGQILDSTDVATTSTNDFWGDLKSALEAIVGAKDGGRSIVISPQSGVIVIRALPEELRNVDAYLKATQLAVDRQVILEAKILEVELNDSFQSGVNWASFASIRSGHDNRVSTGVIAPGASLTPLPFGGGQPAVISDPSTGISGSSGFSLSNAATTAGSMFGLALQTSNFAALMSFLETQGTVHVLSSPRVAAVNNQKAVLKIGTDEFFVTGVQTTTNSTNAGNTTTPSVTLQPFFSGVVLDVTPQIDDKGNILLHVHPSVSQVSTVTKQLNLGSAGSLTLPLASSDTSELDSIVRGGDGEVVAIGGLMRQSSTNQVSELPGAGKLPVLGALFGQKKRVNQKRELVVLIKPTIVEGASNWNQDLLDTGRRIEQLDPRQRGRALMYTAHFGLREPPFGITPDTSYFFGSPGSQEALNTLLVAARGGEGFIKITGEVGTGKTLLCRKFMGTLGPDFVTAYIPNPYLEPRTLMLALADELEIVYDKEIDQHHLLKAITHRLLQLAVEGKRVLLCLDEAQAMPVETLEALRLLTNLETQKRKLLQIVLFGQPELNRKLELDSIRQLAQRITFHYHLGPLSRDELDYYIAHRLRVAGFGGARLFARGAVGKLYAASGGVPRLVNILAHKALMLCYGQGKSQVERAHVLAAARDTLASSKGAGARRRWPWMAAGTLLASCLAAGATWALMR